MAHYVSCVYCLQRFDRDTEETVQISARRYAHANCAQQRETKQSQEEKDYEALENYIMKIFNKEYLTARIKKQIKDYRKEYNYTFSGMLKTLIWWFEIKGNSIEKANEGIGIIPFIYDDACKYYYSLYLAQLANEKIDIQHYQPIVEEIEIAPPQAYMIPPRLFKFGEDMEE